MNNWLHLYKFLCIFGDNKEHPYSEICYHGYNLFNDRHLDYKDIFHKCLECNLLYRDWKTGRFEGDSFGLTKKGDNIFREWSIRLSRGNESYRYFKYYDRSVAGLDKFAPQIKGVQREELDG